MGHPSFAESFGLRELKPGMFFMVWDIAKGQVVETGLITAANIRTDDGAIESVEITYRNADGEEKRFEDKNWGLWQLDSYGPKWSHMMTVSADYLDSLKELPRIPPVPPS